MTGGLQSVALIVRRFSAPDTVPRGGALQAIAMSYSDGFSVGNLMDFKVGAEGQAIEFLGREVNAFRPSATADLHLGANTILEYRYATSEPNTRASKGFDSAPADLRETGPRMTMVNGNPLLENAHHHEVSLSQRMGANKFQLAYYNDRVKDPALLGVGDVDAIGGDVLPDVYSGTFNYNGGELQAQGVRVRLPAQAVEQAHALPWITLTAACWNWISPGSTGFRAERHEPRLGGTQLRSS